MSIVCECVDFVSCTGFRGSLWEGKRKRGTEGVRGIAPAVKAMIKPTKKTESPTYQPEFSFLFASGITTFSL